MCWWLCVYFYYIMWVIFGGWFMIIMLMLLFCWDFWVYLKYVVILYCIDKSDY